MSRYEYRLSLSDVEKFNEKLKAWNYEFMYWSEGCLLGGDYIAIAPGDNMWSFVIYEKYLNSQSSVYVVKRFRKIPKKYWKLINKYKKEAE